MNSHQDLTVKLNNQSKLLSIFTKPSKGQTSILKKKIDENLKNLDPEIKKIIENCKNELEALQDKKEEAIDEFLEEHTEQKILQQKQIEKKFKDMKSKL